MAKSVSACMQPCFGQRPRLARRAHSQVGAGPRWALSCTPRSKAVTR